MNANTLFLRLEGPMQSWGDQQSKFVVRRTAREPTKSGVIGLLCAALGVSRAEAPGRWLGELNALDMGVRTDRPGVPWWDYHTVGARMKMRTAQGKSKDGALLTRREYLCDASFLVALLGDPDLIARLAEAVRKPVWPVYLGRKSCPPGRPLMAAPPGVFPSVASALASVPWMPRRHGERPPDTIDALIDWRPYPGQPEAPADALVRYDEPLSFDPPSHRARFVVRQTFCVGGPGGMAAERSPSQRNTPAPPRPRANYRNTEYRKVRLQRLGHDGHLCVFCKTLATTVQHVTYRHAGGGERLDELRSLCRLCHDAVTMIEYGLNMGLDRIDPEDPRWRERIIAKRDDIIRYRSLETRRRRLAAEEVE